MKLPGNTGLDKSEYQENVFLFLDKNISCGYSLEAPRWGASNEYPQHIFLSRNKKNIDTFWLKKAPYQELWGKYLPYFFMKMYEVHHEKMYLLTCVQRRLKYVATHWDHLDKVIFNRYTQYNMFYE